MAHSTRATPARQGVRRPSAGSAGGLLPVRVVRKFLEDRASTHAVVIAWNLMFASFPIVVTIAALLGLILSSSGISAHQVQRDLLAILPSGAGHDVTDPLSQKKGVLFLVGVVGLVWGGTSLFGALEEAFAVIYHTHPRPFLKQKLMSLSMMLLFSVLTGLIVGTSLLLPALKRLPYFPPALATGPAALVIQVILGSASGFLLFTVIYYVVPNRQMHLRKVWPGALLAGVLLEAVTLLFPIYLNLNKGINQYGAQFGFLFALLTFFYFTAMVLMLGVEMNATMHPVPIEQPDPQI